MFLDSAGIEPAHSLYTALIALYQGQSVRRRRHFMLNTFMLYIIYLLTYLLTYSLTYLLTYLLIPSSRILLEKLNGFQQVKKFPAFTHARHLSLSWDRSIQSMPSHPISWAAILILSSHLRLGLPSGSFPQVSPPKPSICLSSPPYALHALPISFLSSFSPEQYWVSSTDHSAPHYAASSTPLLPRPS